jgi:hypothetical protein
MIQKIEKTIAIALATASIISLALGVAFTIVTGNPGGFLGGFAFFLALAGFAVTWNPTI